MRKILWLTAFVFIFLSCKKDPAPSNRPLTDTHLTSFSRYNAADHILQIDSFTYDTGGQIAVYQSWTFDSTANPILTDSDYYRFSFPSGSLFPNAYIHSWYDKGIASAGTESHLLYYDSQNRLQKDSLSEGLYDSHLVVNYGYSNNFNSIISGEPPQMNSSFVELDTFYLSAGNITVNNKVDRDLPTTDIFRQTLQYGTYTNPFYNKTVAATMGAFFSHALAGDFISLNIANSVTATDTYHTSATPDIVSTETSDYTWVTDSDGKVVSGSATGEGVFYYFRYN